ncbi:hypothetical protein CKO15_00825 [Halorhodospira abdelmalekii]|nr:hypothetical protein [Halorhodospira abdelmalekii]
MNTASTREHNADAPPTTGPGSSPQPSPVTNIVIAGLGGQGIVTGSDILAAALFQAGYDVKKSEIHGMSQRGGSVCSDIRFGARVDSPMVPAGCADYLVITEPSQVAPNRHRLRPQGYMMTPDTVPFLFQDDDPKGAARAARMINVALLGVLSAHLPLSDDQWLTAIRSILPERLHEMNSRVFLHARRIEAILSGLRHNPAADGELGATATHPSAAAAASPSPSSQPSSQPLPPADQDQDRSRA